MKKLKASGSTNGYKQDINYTACDVVGAVQSGNLKNMANSEVNHGPGPTKGSEHDWSDK